MTTTSKHQCLRRAALNLALLGWLKDEDRGKRSHINVARATNFKDLI